MFEEIWHPWSSRSQSGKYYYIAELWIRSQKRWLYFTLANCIFHQKCIEYGERGKTCYCPFLLPLPKLIHLQVLLKYNLHLLTSICVICRSYDNTSAILYSCPHGNCHQTAKNGTECFKLITFQWRKAFFFYSRFHGIRSHCCLPNCLKSCQVHRQVLSLFKCDFLFWTKLLKQNMWAWFFSCPTSCQSSKNRTQQSFTIWKCGRSSII